MLHSIMYLFTFSDGAVDFGSFPLNTNSYWRNWILHRFSSSRICDMSNCLQNLNYITD